MTAGSRDKFDNKLEYLFTALSYAVGLGNVWRFPYLCYRNGGGSFLVPYLLSLLFLGLTFFFFESSIGQFTSQGPVQVWKLTPIFRGIGAAMFFIAFFVGVYYNMIVAWSLYYLYASFTAMPSLPWANCNNTWNTENCFESSLKHQSNLTKTLSPSHEYFYNNALEMSSGIADLGPLRPHLVTSLAVAWVIVFLGLCLGTKSLGKISYFTCIVPYFMITCLLINGVQLDGAMDGILHYIKPDFEKLASIEVWADAATQIFFSLSICMGGTINLASYNPFYSNTLRDSIIIVIFNSMTSVYAGFAIFSVIGFMAKQLNLPIDQASDQGVGLAFVAYPAALARLPYAPYWSGIFFLTLLLLGLGTQLSSIESIVATLVDFWPSKLQKRKPYVLAVVCLLMFFCALPMCTGSGIYILQLMDTYSVPYSAFIIGFFEVIAIAWVYGIDKHLDNINRMMGYTLWPRVYWKYTFKYVCPAFISLVLGLVLYKFKPLTYNDYTYPLYAEYIGWALTLSSVLMIPVFALYELVQVFCGKKTMEDILRPEVDFHNDALPSEKPIGSKLQSDLFESQGYANGAFVEEDVDYIGRDPNILYEMDRNARLLNFSAISTWKRNSPLKKP